MEPDATADMEPMHERVYRAVRNDLVAGRLAPGDEVALMSLAAALQAGIMPTREAVRRLVAERALELTETRRIRVPALPAADAIDLLRGRQLLEPECAVRAMPFVDQARLRRARGHDATMRGGRSVGRAERLVACDHAFHFELYRAAPAHALLPLVESLWMCASPAVRAALVGREKGYAGGYHAAMLSALEDQDAPALRAAIAADIEEGIALFATDSAAPEAPPPQRRRSYAKAATAGG